MMILMGEEDQVIGYMEVMGRMVSLVTTVMVVVVVVILETLMTTVTCGHPE